MTSSYTGRESNKCSFFIELFIYKFRQPKNYIDTVFVNHFLNNTHIRKDKKIYIFYSTRTLLPGHFFPNDKLLEHFSQTIH